MNVPGYLKDYADLYATDPRAAAKQWFKDAKYGLFLHYGLYSLIGDHEWVQLRRKISVDEMETYKDKFTAEKFDADAIVDFAVRCGMKYINLTTRHHECFCLFETKETDFNSVNSPAKRDLVGELIAAGAKRDIGICLYYSHGRDWRHPHAPNNDSWGGAARPQYETPEPRYAYGEEHDLQKYIDFMTAQITELLTNYGPVASIWLDGIAVPLNGDTEAFKCQELYDHIHSLQPQVLVSYKQGITGTEDYFAPEHQVPNSDNSKIQGVIGQNQNALLEVCTTMTPKSWGYTKSAEGTHKTANEVWEELRKANLGGYNLLLNTGPLPDGSLDTEDVETLLSIGERLRSEGFPN